MYYFVLLCQCLIIISNYGFKAVEFNQELQNVRKQHLNGSLEDEIPHSITLYKSEESEQFTMKDEGGTLRQFLGFKVDVILMHDTFVKILIKDDNEDFWLWNFSSNIVTPSFYEFLGPQLYPLAKTEFSIEIRGVEVFNKNNVNKRKPIMKEEGWFFTQHVGIPEMDRMFMIKVKNKNEETSAQRVPRMLFTSYSFTAAKLQWEVYVNIEGKPDSLYAIICKTVDAATQLTKAIFPYKKGVLSLPSGILI